MFCFVLNDVLCCVVRPGKHALRSRRSAPALWGRPVGCLGCQVSMSACRYAGCVLDKLLSLFCFHFMLITHLRDVVIYVVI